MVRLTFLLNVCLVALMVPGDASLPWIAAEPLVLEAYQAAQQFRASLSLRPEMSTEDGVALEGLSGTTVILAFVESYGVTALMGERYRPILTPSLKRLGQPCALGTGIAGTGGLAVHRSG